MLKEKGSQNTKVFSLLTIPFVTMSHKEEWEKWSFAFKAEISWNLHEGQYCNDKEAKFQRS